MYRFSKQPLLLSLLAGLVLSGCSSQTQPPVATSGPDTFTPSAYTPGEFNANSLYHLLTAELAGKQGRFDLALDNYLQEAEATGDAAVAERATRIAQFLRRPAAVLKASQLWSEAAPDALEPLHIQANILLHEGRFEAALPLMQQLIENGGNEALSLIAGRIDEMSPEIAGHYSRLLTEISTSFPQRLDLLLTRALLLKQQQRPDEAARLLDQGLRLSPNETELALQRAELFRLQGAYSEGLKLVERALKDTPDHRRLQATRAQLLLLSGQPRRAWQAIQDLLAEQDNAQLSYYFALLLLENERWQESQTLLQQLLEEDPTTTAPHFYLGVIAQTRQQPEQALRHYLQVEDGPNLIQAHARALALYDQPQQAAEVEALIDLAIRKHPEQRESLIILYVEWLQRQEMVDAALEILNQALANTPDSINLLYTRAMLSGHDDAERMISDLRRALALAPDNPMVQNALGYTLTLYTDQLNEAHALISRALAQQPDDAATLDSMGWILHKLGRHGEARHFLQRAYDSHPDPEVGGHLIQVLWALGEQQAARELLTNSLEQHPDNEHLLDAASVIGVTP
ncbi:tetratricopeptide repeat protein [Marinobacterium sediminicola]|uniref:Lipopolysaccharide biosynthesis regulator YciM, contains six TPR domains and a predicted metal-binding C-terminal domain n=1 Tax=Marinobacterium sediminicola TaxID=518898 RepID=A0ABY1S1X6_9GAMM|nr:tetratricopeptide repeat protein [Marinobacterium sediminicola]ULG69745.1 tetratricopeptide repeat protein [Marinobacterium sediminicola]SMR75445.1 Lipopolysaccharide biosynthesis regulator YciM, contains six TPR domains and a predicted metal-binding C-terminal domain [Marinobacterium sediminicola]